MGRQLLFVVFVLMLPAGVWAEDVINMRIHNQYNSPRLLGMGNAGIAAVDDYNSLMINPAALARLQDWQMNFATEYMFGTDITEFADKMQKASDTSGSESAKQQAIVDAMKSMYGTYHYLRTAPLSGFWVWHKYGVGFIPADVTTDLSLHQQVGPSVIVSALSDTTLIFGHGQDFPWFENARFSLGGSLKAVYRVNMNKGLSAVDLVGNNEFFRKDLADEGMTVDGDIGALLTPDLPTEGVMGWFRLARPTFGLVVRNVLDYGFTQNMHIANDNSKEPEKLHRVYDIGSRWEYPSFWIFSSRGMLDFRNIGHPNITPLKALHLGWEFSWKLYSWWKGAYRVGISEGYLTSGISARFAWFNLDLVTWGEEVGSAARRQESRLWMIKMNIEL